MEMNFWFEAKVKMDVMQNDGMTKPETFVYLVDALSFKEAEDRVIEECKPFTNGNLDVLAVKRVRLSDIFFTDDETAARWYRVKLMLMTIDEKTKTEKETPVVLMVQASDFEDAVKRLKKDMSGSLIDWRIVNFTETKIEDVYKYLSKNGDNGK